MSDSRRVLPVVRWLQVGAATAGLGMALGMASLATSGVATADDGAASAPSAERASHQSARAGSAAAQRSKNRPVQSAASQAARNRTVRQTADAAPASSVRATLAAPTAASVTASPTASASAAAPSAKPGRGTVRATMRLNMEDRRTGTGKPIVSTGQEATVVNGLFAEILRRTPTADELNFYTRRLNMSGVNGVIAGLYNSQEFRANAVDNYYLELLGRTPTQQEVTRGVVRLTFGTEPAYAARIAGTQDFYTASASGGGKYGTQPSADTYVKLLYRSLLGATTPPNSVDPLVTQIEAGLPISRAANEFVNTDAYRTVKVEEIYQVLGQAASPTEVQDLVNNWLRNGGQGGISRSLLATAANIQRIEAGLVTLPDMAAAAVLQTLLLAPYIDGETGFNEQYKKLIGDCSNTGAPACKNPAAYALLKNGGIQRGIPNGGVSTYGIAATIANLVPTQNEINLGSSLNYPLQNKDTLENYFKGGIIYHFAGPVITANDGTYIVDGHHRWSAVYLINPNTQIIAYDLGYVPNPQTALRESQLAIAATNGVLKESRAGNPNVYTVERPVFDAFVATTIADGNDTEGVIATFGKYISTEAKWAALSPEQKMTQIQNYLWNNVLRMRAENPYIPDAPSRVVMPQFDPTLPTLQNLDGGSVTYSFPTISYLG